MIEHRPSPPNAGERFLALAAMALVPLLATLDWARFHPGWAKVDENSVFVTLDQWRRLGMLPWRPTGGSLHHLCMILGGRLWVGLAGVHAPATVAVTAEALLLFAVVRRLAGERAALWATLADLISAFTVMRARSLLSFSLLPCEWLLLVWLFLRHDSPKARFLVGALATAWVFDYELWLAGVPWLLAAAWLHESRARARWSLTAGVVLGMLLIAALRADYLRAWWLQRNAVTLPHDSGTAGWYAVHNLRAFFLGGQVFPYIHPSGHEVFPAWAWPGLGLGLALAWRRWRRGFLFMAAALTPLLLRSPGLEPQRALLAWPLLCGFCGWGFAAGLDRLDGQAGHWARRASTLLLLLPLAGAGREAVAYKGSLDRIHAGLYGTAAAQCALLEARRGDPGRPPLLASLDQHDSAALRYLDPGADPGNAADAVAVVPDYWRGAMAGWPGRWEEVHGPGGEGSLSLFHPAGEALPRLERANRDLQTVWDRLRPGMKQANVAVLRAALDGPGCQDPLVRSALWSELLEALDDDGQLQDADIRAVLLERLPSAQPYRETAFRVGRRRPDWAWALMEQAERSDSRYPFSPDLRAPLAAYLRASGKLSQP